MRAPPAARWRVERKDPLWQGLHSVLSGLAALAVLLWLLERALDQWPEWHQWATDGPFGHLPTLMVVAVLMIASAVALAAWRREQQQAGWLMWTGSCWRWQADGAPALDVAARLMLDMEGWMLLLLRPAASAHWRSPRLWISVKAPAANAAEQVQWTAFRAAVYCAASRPDAAFEPNHPPL